MIADEISRYSNFAIKFQPRSLRSLLLRKCAEHRPKPAHPRELTLCTSSHLQGNHQGSGLLLRSFIQPYLLRSAETPAELERAIAVLEAQELGCHRYAGTDPAILNRLSSAYCHYPMQSPSATEEVGLTFSGIALLATNNAKRRRMNTTARKAYDTNARLRRRVMLTGAEEATVDHNLLRLRSELQSLGQGFDEGAVAGN